MTLAELYDEIRDEILHRASLEDPRLLRQINLIHAELQKGIKLPTSAERRYWRCQKTTSETLTYPAAGASMTVAAACRKVRHVNRVLDDGGTEPITGASEEEVQRLIREDVNSRRAGQGGFTIVTRWYPVGSASVGIYPAPEDALAIQADYYALLPDYGSGDPAVTTDWFLENIPLVLAYGVAAKMAAGQRDSGFAAECRAEFGNLLATALGAEVEEEQGENATVYRPPLRGNRFER